jgi:hypothetical protein
MIMKQVIIKAEILNVKALMCISVTSEDNHDNAATPVAMQNITETMSCFCATIHT